MDVNCSKFRKHKIHWTSYKPNGKHFSTAGASTKLPLDCKLTKEPKIILNHFHACSKFLVCSVTSRLIKLLVWWSKTPLHQFILQSHNILKVSNVPQGTLPTQYCKNKLAASKSKLSWKRTYLLNKIVISLVRHRVIKYVMPKLWIRIGEREYIIFLGCKFHLANDLEAWENSNRFG